MKYLTEHYVRHITCKTFLVKTYKIQNVTCQLSDITCNIISVTVHVSESHVTGSMLKVPCHMSCVTYHMKCVTYNMSHDNGIYLDFFVLLFCIGVNLVFSCFPKI